MNHHLRKIYQLLLFFLLSGGWPTIGQAQPAVMSLQPAPNSSVDRRGPVQITFAQPVLNSVVGALQVFGTQGGRKSGQATVSGTTLTFTPTMPFAAGEKLWLTLNKANVQDANQLSLARSQVWQLTAATAPSNAHLTPGGAFSTGPSANFITPADLDGDGDLDVLSLSSNYVLNLRLNNGSGRFTPVADQRLSTCYSLALGDLDGDGDLDLLTAGSEFNSATYTVYINQGGGLFAAAPAVSLAAPATALTLGDVDGDGDLDLLFTYGSTQLSVRLNKGTGSFTNTTNTILPGSFGTLAALGDLDNDGDLDVLAADQTAGKLLKRLNNGSGTFSDAAAIATDAAPEQVRLADLNGDGYLDLLASYGDMYSRQYALAVRLNQGNGTFGPAATWAVPAYVVNPTLADLNGDGAPDLLYGSAQNLVVQLNRGTGAFAAATATTFASSLSGLAVLDADGDGDLDVLAAEDISTGRATRLTMLCNGPGAATIAVAGFTPAPYRTASRTVAVTATLSAPLATTAGMALRVQGTQGQGQLAGLATVAGPRLELAPTTSYRPGEVVRASLTQAARSSSGAALAQPRVWQFVAATAGGTGNFSNGQFVRNDKGGAQFLRLGDIDGDGDLDIVTSLQAGFSGYSYPELGLFTVQRNRGNGTFEAPAPLLGDYISGEQFVLADVDGDGDLDFMGHTVRYNPQTAQSLYAGSVWLNNGQGTFTARGVVDNYSGSVRAMGDLDGDGDLDLIDRGVRYNDGTGNFYGTGLAWTTADSRSSELVDLDNDGDLDCVSNTDFYNGHYYQLNDGNGLLGPGTLLGWGGFSEDILARDLDGDGDVDFVTFASQVQLNNGQGSFTQAGVLDSYDYSLAIGDVNGDGSPDVITSAHSYLNDGRAHFTATPWRLLRDQVSSTVNRAALGDLDNDGDLDLVLTYGFNSAIKGWAISLNPNQAALATTPAAAAGFGCWPNPVAAGSSLTVRLPAIVPAATLTLCTLLGQSVWSRTLTLSESTIPLGSLPAGVYLLSLSAAGQPTTTQRLLVE